MLSPPWAASEPVTLLPPPSSATRYSALPRISSLSHSRPSSSTPPDPEKPFHGYLGNIPGLHNFKSLAIMNGLMETLASVRRHSILPNNCHSWKRLVQRMVLESLGVPKYLA